MNEHIHMPCTPMCDSHCGDVTFLHKTSFSTFGYCRAATNQSHVPNLSGGAAVITGCLRPWHILVVAL